MSKNVLITLVGVLVIIALGVIYVMQPDQPETLVPVAPIVDTRKVEAPAISVPTERPRLTDSMRDFNAMPSFTEERPDTARERGRRGPPEFTPEMRAQMERGREAMQMTMRAFQSNTLAMFDKNGDGVLDESETAAMQAYMRKQGEEMRELIQSRFGDRDFRDMSDEDRRTAMQEGMKIMSTLTEQTFTTFDKDGDGKFSEAEEAAFAQDMLERFRNGETMASRVKGVMNQIDQDRDRANLAL